jgi:hypothetical protein
MRTQCRPRVIRVAFVIPLLICVNLLACAGIPQDPAPGIQVIREDQELAAWGQAAHEQTPSDGAILHQDGTALYVMGRVNQSAEVLFVVDSGSTMTVLRPWAVARLSPAPRIVGSRESVGIGGSVTAPVVRLGEVEVGDAQVTRVDAMMFDMPGFPWGVGGILGLDFLSHFRVVLDVSNGTLLLARHGQGDRACSPVVAVCGAASLRQGLRSACGTVEENEE